MPPVRRGDKVQPRNRTAEQQRLRAEVDERNRRIQEAAIKPPPSGVFGRVTKKDGR